MPRQSITLTPPNDEWLKSQLESAEFASKSELVNALIRQARQEQAEIDYIRAKLIRSEQSGVSMLSPAEILEKSRAEMRLNAKL